MPKLHNKYHKTAPTDAVYIGRPSKWGNPYSHMPDTLAQHKCATREEAVTKYSEWISTQPDLVQQAKKELRGKDLVCYCAPKSCHGDILIKIANEV